jgi:hypothetical protein
MTCISFVAINNACLSLQSVTSERSIIKQTGSIKGVGTCIYFRTPA